MKQEGVRRHPEQMLKLPQLVPFDMKELHSAPPPEVGVLCLISKGELHLLITINFTLIIF